MATERASKSRRGTWSLLAVSILLAAVCLAAVPPSGVARSAERGRVGELIDVLMDADFSNQERVDAAYELMALRDRSATRDLIVALRSEDTMARLLAAQVLTALQDERSIEALVLSLADQTSDVAEAAKQALKTFRHAAEPALLRALDDSNPKVGWRAAQLLGELGNPAGSEQLFDQAKRGARGERVAALKILTELRDARAAVPLAEFLVAEEQELANEADKALRSFVGGSPEAAAELSAMLEERTEAPLRLALIRVLGASRDERFLRLLPGLAGGAERVLRAAALANLGARRDPAYLPLLLKGAGEADAAVRKAAVQGLGKIRDERARSELLRLLVEDEEIGREVERGLVDAGPAVIPRLVPLLGHGQARVRLLAIRVLGGLRDRSVVEDLIRSSRDADEEVAAAAVSALGQLGGDRAARRLVEVLGLSPEPLATAALEALGGLGVEAVAPLLEAFSRNLAGVTEARAATALVGIGEPAVGALEKLWKRGSPRERLLALRALGGIGGDRAWQVVQEGTESSSAAERRAAAEVIVRYGGRSVRILLKLLEDTSESVRAQAARSLGTMGRRRAVAQLAKRLPEESGEVRKAILEALVRVPAAGPTEHLLGLLDDPDPVVRSLAARALGEGKRREAVARLIGLLGDESADVRAAALEALGLIADPLSVGPVSGLLKAGEEEVRLKAAEILGEIGDYSVVGPLLGALDDESPPVRSEALSSLTFVLQRVEPGTVVFAESDLTKLLDLLDRTELGKSLLGAELLRHLGPEAVPVLIEAARVRGPGVRMQAIAALGRIGDKRAATPLLELLETGDDPRLDTVVIGSLGRIGDTKALTPLIRRLASPDASIRAMAAEALGRIGDDRAVGGLLKLLEDPDVRVRKNAQGALERLTGDKCPLLSIVEPLPYVQPALFGVMLVLLAIPLARKANGALDSLAGRVAKRIEPGERAQWWIAIILGAGGLTLLVYSIYCQITRPELEAPIAGFLPNLYIFTLKVFPFFVGGCLISGVIMKYFSTRWKLPKSMLGACALGSTLPLCSCGVVPMTRAMLSLDIPLRAVVAFLVVTPVLNPFVVVLSYGVIGPEYTLWRVGGTFLVAMLIGIIMERSFRVEAVEEAGGVCGFCKSCVSKDTASSDSGLINGLKLMGMLHRYIIIGVILGALISAYVPMYLVTKYLGSDIFGLMLAVVIGIPIYLCTGEEVIFLKPLLDLGLPMGHAIAFTIAANGICVTSVAVLFGVLGKRTTVVLTLLFGVVSFALGYVINLF